MSQVAGVLVAADTSSQSLHLGNQGVDVNWSISGTFSATIYLEREQAPGSGSWLRLKTLTAPASGTHRGIPNDRIRFRCATYTSGTVVHQIADQDVVEASVRDADGNTVASLSKAGQVGGAASRSNPIVARHRRMGVGFSTSLAAAVIATGVNSYFYVMPLPSDAYAARLVFANNAASTWDITAACIAPSDSVSDYINPTVAGSTANGALGWVAATFLGAGVDSDNIILGDTTLAATVPAAGDADPLTGATLVPSFFYSDFVPIAPVNPSPAVRYLFIRVCLPAETYMRSNWTPGATTPTGVSWTGNTALNSGFDASIRATNADKATAPGVFVGGTSAGVFGPVFGIEYMSAVPGINVLTMGDSQIEGATTTVGMCNFVTRAATALSTPQLPISMRTSAWGGQPSDLWWPMFKKIISTVPPSVAVLQATSGNDTPATIPGYMRGIGRALAAAKWVQDAGGVAILCTPFPRPTDDVTNWKYRRNEILKLAASDASLLVFDCAAGIGSQSNGDYDGGYLAGMSGDALHPNDAAHGILAAAFKPLLRQVIGAR